jgi:hypothetical protein
MTSLQPRLLRYKRGGGGGGGGAVAEPTRHDCRSASVQDWQQWWRFCEASVTAAVMLVAELWRHSALSLLRPRLHCRHVGNGLCAVRLCHHLPTLATAALDQLSPPHRATAAPHHCRMCATSAMFDCNCMCNFNRSCLAETLDGLATVRAFGAQERFRRQFRADLDGNTAAFYAFLFTGRWLGFW